MRETSLKKNNHAASEAARADVVPKKMGLIESLMASPAKIWKSWVSWRIATTAFLTILIIQVSLLLFTHKSFERDQLSQLREIARSAIIPLVNPTTSDFLASPITEQSANRLFSTSRLKGLTIYGQSMGLDKPELIAQYGEPTATILTNEDKLDKKYRSPDGSSYEFIFRTSTLSAPYFMVVRMDSSSVKANVISHVFNAVIVMVLMSLLVTTVLMIALGRWLLEPILFLRNNLLAASKDPENPNIKPSPFDVANEIGGAIVIANRLIEQNAENIRRIKSAAEDKIHKLAYYDTLTNLPNRTLFLQSLAERINSDQNDGKVERFAIVAVDLDHFKDINDSMGHNVGDAILRGVGKRLRAAMPDSAFVSRTGEDEFAITVPLYDGTIEARDVAEKVISVIRVEPFRVFNEQFQIRASIGVSTFPDDGIDPDQVLKNADIALNRAKEEGRDKISEYSEDFDRAVQARFQMLRDLRDALEHNQLILHYQPQLDLKTGEVIGAEALLRWWKPDNSKNGGTFISPGDFIPVAEQSGLIVPIGEWVIRTACTAAKQWKDECGYKGRIAINVSGVQFSQSDLVSFVHNTMEEIQIDPKNVELEVTESVFMDDINHTIQTLQDLHMLGIELAIDDFGTGYSSLSYLRQFPIDRLKIDQSFIRNALNNADDASITKTIITLGHSLSLKVIAEGVETIEHERFLQQYLCDEVQGYRYSKPVKHEDFMAFLKSYPGKLDHFES